MNLATRTATPRLRPILERMRNDRPPLDLLLIAALLLLTAGFGRGFSKVGIEAHSIFVTEVFLVASIGLVLLRFGPRAAFAQARARIPLIPLAVFWLAGAIALVRGVADWGFSQTVEDAGLLEYSIVMVLLAIAIDTRERVAGMVRLLGYAGLLAAVLGALTRFLPDAVWPMPGPDPEPALGLYVGLYCVWLATRLAHRHPVARIHWGLGVLAVVMLVLTDKRSVWLGVVALTPLIVALAPRGRVLRTALACTATLVIGVVLATALQGFDPNPPPSGGGEPTGQSSEPAITRELSGLTENSGSEESENVRWRLAIWEHALGRAARENPVAGAGFGAPIAFSWHGKNYDYRNTKPVEPTDAVVTGPHNDFVHVAFRMGYPALIALVALIAIAVFRTAPLLRSRERRDLDRADAATLLGMMALACDIAFFNDGIKAPFIGLFFWAVLGVLLALLSMALNRPDEASA